MKRIPWVISLLGLVALIAISATEVHAATVTITCVAPTQNTDGTTLTDLASFNFYGAFSNKLLGSSTVAAGCRFVEQNSAVGNHQYYATAVSSKGVESAASNTVSIDVPPPVVDTDGDGIADPADQCPTVKGVPPSGCPQPKPPTAVQGSITAYEYDATRKTMSVVGIAWPGTECSDETVTVAKKVYHSIAAGPETVDYISGSSTAKKLPLKVWAICDAPPTALLEKPEPIRAEAPGIWAEVTG